MKRRRQRADLLEPQPPLSDDAVVAVANFLAELLRLFENRHYGQIHRYYQSQRGDRDPVVQHPPTNTPPLP